MHTDFLSGLVLLAIAGLYYLGTGTIADSTLSDEVGATGLPRVLSIALAGLGFLLIVRTLLAHRQTARATNAGSEEGDARLARGVGFLTFGLAYILVLPFLGYIVSIALLIATIALYERAERRWVVPATAIGGAVFYWAIFVKLLGVNQPTGSLWQSLLS